MANKPVIFISHIHEEKELALLFQNSLREEFAGFVEVFVSSDGESIPAGAKFLDKIEKGLSNCSAGVFLISLKSVERSWVNFELGGLWIRNLSQRKQGLHEIPIIPICHSGLSPSNLPKPLGDLQAVSLDDPIHLKYAFASIQKALGADVDLKTDFEQLSRDAVAIERRLNLGANLLRLFKALDLTDIEAFLVSVEDSPDLETVCFEKRLLESSYKVVEELAADELRSCVAITPGGKVGTIYSAEGARQFKDACLSIDIPTLLEFKGLLRQAISSGELPRRNALERSAVSGHVVDPQDLITKNDAFSVMTKEGTTITQVEGGIIVKPQSDERIMHITNDAELDAACKALDALIDRDDELTPDEDSYRQTLENLITDYERRHHPIPPASSRDVILHLMEARNVTEAELSAVTGIVPDDLAAILDGQREPTVEEVRALCGYFGVSESTFGTEQD